jgi:hypothetical protein
MNLNILILKGSTLSKERGRPCENGFEEIEAFKDF